MRYFLIFLSVLFFILAAFVFYRALEIPAGDKGFINYQKPPEPVETNSNTRKASPPQPAEGLKNENNMVKELQAAINDLEDDLTRKEEELREIAERVKKPKTLAVLGSGTFLPGQVVVNKDIDNTIDQLAGEILASPGYRILIEGHTDNVPITSTAGKRYRDNIELSFLRAKAVADLLIKRGIPFERISVTGYGDTRPLASNETEEGRAGNRRVEIKLVPEEKENQ